MLVCSSSTALIRTWLGLADAALHIPVQFHNTRLWAHDPSTEAVAMLPPGPHGCSSSDEAILRLPEQFWTTFITRIFRNHRSTCPALTSRPILQVMNTDITILGSGASGTHLLLRILNRLDSTTRKVNITVIDRDHQFHSGVPYGHRSGPSSLLITHLADFLPARELSDFIRWLNEHREQIVTSPRIDSEWIAKHRADINNGSWEDLYLPRRVYGRYLRQQAEAAIQAAEQQGTAQVNYVNADISEVIPQEDGTLTLRGNITHCPDTTVNVQPLETSSTPSLPKHDGYEALSVSGSTVIDVRTLTVALAVGSPPVRRLPVNAPAKRARPSIASSDSDGLEASDRYAGYIADIHSPAIGRVLDRVRSQLRKTPPEQRRMLVIGGNADALEFILASNDLRKETGSEICVLSTEGHPHHWRHQGEGERPEMPALNDYLDEIAQGTAAAAHVLLAAVEADVARSIRNGTDKATIAAITEVIGRVVGHMNDTENGKMADEYGLRISNQIRRAGGDAIDLLDSLITEDAITFEPGRYESATCDDKSMFTVTLRRLRDNESAPRFETLPHAYPIIVNATGFETVADTRSHLLRQMQENSIARVSQSRAGLATDNNFRAAKGIYVIGPLLSGFHDGGTAVWHAENVSRIIELADRVAPYIIADALDRSQHPVSSAVGSRGTSPA